MEHLNAMGLRIEDVGCSNISLLKRFFNEDIKILGIRIFEKDQIRHLIITLPRKKGIFDKRQKIEIEIYPWEKSDIVLANRKIDALGHYLTSKVVREESKIKSFASSPATVVVNNDKKAA
jgi:hypothetical protein